MVKRKWRLGVATLVAVLGLLAPAGTAISQQLIAPGGAQRNCQTVRTCEFSRRAAVRGCLSSYTCRTCKTVRSRCDVSGNRLCERIVCSWGG
jgi:hypothetical protein